MELKINVVELADKLASIDLKKEVCTHLKIDNDEDFEEEVYEISPTDPNCLQFKSEYQEKYIGLYDYYFDLISEFDTFVE